MILSVLLLIFLVFQHIKFKNTRITQVDISSESQYKITVNSEVIDIVLFGECIVTSFMIWLNFKDEKNKKKYYLLLLPDSATRNELRQLRIRLRLFANKKLMTHEA